MATTTDHFMHRRPAKGKAFFCANDLLMLVSIYTSGVPKHQSQTNARSLSILYENGLITSTDQDARLTESGRVVFDRILNSDL